MTPDEIALFLSSILPDELQRRQVLSALAESIRESNRIEAGGWGVSLRRDRSCVRLNVGPIEVFVISRGEPARILVASGALRSPLPDGGVALPAGEYESVKEAQPVLLQISRFATVWPAIRESHLSLLRIASARRKGYVWKDSHSTAFLDYLRSFLGQPLPSPTYVDRVDDELARNVSHEEEILHRLIRTYDQLLADGKLPTRQQLDGYYARFAAQFGPAALKSLDGTRLLEHMHDHGNRESLVYWLEYKDDDDLPAFFGSIIGGSALKFGLYRRKDSGVWMTGTSQNQRTLTEDEAVALARRSRDQLAAAAEVFTAAPSNFDDATYAALQKRLFVVAPDVANTAWAHKYLHMLFPAKLDNFHVVDYQRFHLTKLLQLPPTEEGRYAAGGRYAALTARLSWPMVHLMETLNALNGRPYRYWRVGTSDGNEARKYWPMMRDGNVVAIGWPGLGDLSKIQHDSDSRDEVKTRLEQHYPADPRAVGRTAQQIFNFVTAIDEGSLVLASDGGTVLGIGRVLGPYQFVEGAKFPHQRPVKWLSLREWRMPEPEGLQTAIHEVRKYRQNLIAVEKQLLDGERAKPASPSPTKPPSSSSPIPTPQVLPPPSRHAPPLEKISGEIQRILERKGQAILYGPPGTGKTHWAELTVRDLALHWALGRSFSELEESEKKLIIGPGGKPLVRMCCFHPSYGYEDFIEGHRPEAGAAGALVFKLRDGIFKSLCNDAAKDPDRRYYLIVDEINRGDIPRIFGELLTLLEPARRGSRSLVLPLSGQAFTVPTNVYVVGTMNTADRSIALIDIALRRRFGFVELMPAPEVLRDVTVAGIPLGPLLRLINQRIHEKLGRDARNLQIGHSFFLNAGKPLSDMSQLRRVLLDDVIPLLEEYCYDDWEKFEHILSSKLVDGTSKRVRRELFEEASQDQLITALLSLDPSLATSREATSKAPVGDDSDDDLDDDAEATPSGGLAGDG